MKVVKRNTKRARETPGVSYVIIGEKPPLGEGGRFKILSEAIGRRSNVTNPEAVAASIGRRKYGKRRFQGFASKGRRRQLRLSPKMRKLPR